jgi:hypothetical protein
MTATLFSSNTTNKPSPIKRILDFLLLFNINVISDEIPTVIPTSSTFGKQQEKSFDFYFALGHCGAEYGNLRSRNGRYDEVVCGFEAEGGCGREELSLKKLAEPET